MSGGLEWPVWRREGQGCEKWLLFLLFRPEFELVQHLVRKGGRGVKVLREILVVETCPIFHPVSFAREGGEIDVVLKLWLIAKVIASAREKREIFGEPSRGRRELFRQAEVPTEARI